MADDWKRWITSPIAGGIVGVFAGGLTVLLIESAGHALFGTADPGDLESVTALMFASVLVAWTLGAAVGSTVATAWARSKSHIPGIVAGAFILAAAVSNLFVIPHPWWMVVGALTLIPAAAFLATRWRVRAVAV